MRNALDSMANEAFWAWIWCRKRQRVPAVLSKRARIACWPSPAAVMSVKGYSKEPPWEGSPRKAETLHPLNSDGDVAAASVADVSSGLRSLLAFQTADTAVHQCLPAIF